MKAHLRQAKRGELTFFFDFAHLFEETPAAAEIVARIRAGRGRIALLARHLFAAELTIVQRFVQIDQLLLAQALAHLSLSLQALAAD